MFGISARAGNPGYQRPAGSARKRQIWIAGILGFSTICTVAGFAALFAFEQTAGAVSNVPSRWPASTVLERRTEHGSLLVFVHPYCSCTVATLHEIATLSADRKSKNERHSTTIVFYRPANSGWKPGALWNNAHHDIPDAQTVWDDGGQEAQRFGARTSGYALFYDARGNLLFKGGVTGSRGHEGDNFGIGELRTAIDSGRPARRSSLVFGCDLASLNPLRNGERQ
jgi:hypothetical protein